MRNRQGQAQAVCGQVRVDKRQFPRTVRYIRRAPVADLSAMGRKMVRKSRMIGVSNLERRVQSRIRPSFRMKTRISKLSRHLAVLFAVFQHKTVVAERIPVPFVRQLGDDPRSLRIGGGLGTICGINDLLSHPAG